MQCAQSSGLVLVNELIRLYPRLYHMAADGSWPSIRQHGLLSSERLLQEWEVPGPARDRALTEARRDSIRLEHPALGTAVVRDQKPIHVPSLQEALSDLTVAEWLRELNSRVFFFLYEEALSVLLKSPSYRNEAHTVLTIDTALFVTAHENEIELTTFNTGFAQRHNKKARSRESFVPLAEFSHPHRDVARVGSSNRDVVELCVKDAVSDIAAHVIRVDLRQGDEVIRRIE
jgi:hypothetical protein